ncbi:MAG: acyltransferase, partial [Myxococcota bacterium]
MQHASGIDAWRGLSVALVVLHHVAIRLPLADSALAAVVPARALSAANWNGYEAVCVFFVISGFLITTHTLDRDGDARSVRPAPFWVRRFARIAPPLAVVVAVLSALHLAGVEHYVIQDPDQSLLGAIVSASTLWLNWYEGHTGYLPGGWDVLWSLSVEEVFYLAFPLVVLACRDERVLAGVGLAFALTMPVTHGWNHDLPIWREKHYLPGMAAIALGVATAVAARQSWLSPA